MEDLQIEVRTRREEDFAGIIRVMQNVYPPARFGSYAIWKEQNLRRHLERFPEGQHVALGGGGVVGTSTSMRTTRALALAPHTWPDITGRGSLSTHDPAGEVLYGVNIAVDPPWQNKGVGRALYEARIRLARQLGCMAFVAGARIPGYETANAEMTPEEYVAAVSDGDLYDPTLSKQMRIGFRVAGVLRDYSPDPETCGHAALIVMELS